MTVLSDKHFRYCPNFPPDQVPNAEHHEKTRPSSEPVPVRRMKVSIIGSGNWGSTVAKICASNALKHSSVFDPVVRMWVYEEQIDGHNLTDIINQRNENPKYLPGIKLGSNVNAIPDVKAAADGADILVLVSPHQFLSKICRDLVKVVGPDACAISLIKGMDITPSGPQLLSSLVRQELGIECSVLMGANIANDVAAEQFSEATIGYRLREHGELFHKLFHTDYFHCTPVEDVEGTELCGTLKNVVALSAGFSDGLNLGSNSKAAFMRIGMNEMRKLSRTLYPSVKDETYFQSCGMADLITTCIGGRNRKVAEAFVKAKGQKSWEELEKELLNGQKLQGVLTCQEVQQLIHAKGWEKQFPLFTTIHKIVNKQLDPSELVNYARV